MAMWPSTACAYAMLISRYRAAFEACFRRIDALLEELKAAEQKQS
ncbi:MAG: hypothetical protein AB7T32_03130 [Dehalococcoidia bacterium]